MCVTTILAASVYTGAIPFDYVSLDAFLIIC